MEADDPETGTRARCPERTERREKEGQVQRTARGENSGPVTGPDAHR